MFDLIKVKLEVLQESQLADTLWNWLEMVVVLRYWLELIGIKFERLEAEQLTYHKRERAQTDSFLVKNFPKTSFSKGPSFSKGLQGPSFSKGLQGPPHQKFSKFCMEKLKFCVSVGRLVESLSSYFDTHEPDSVGVERFSKWMRFSAMNEI